MKNETFEIKRTSDDVQSIATLVTAFAADPAVRWMYPGSRQYLPHFPDFVRAFAGRAFECETAERVDGFRGAALWLSPDVQPDEAALGGVLEESVVEERLPEVISVMEQMGQFHPQEPHWYLPLIGIDPAAQRKGLSSALLRHALKRCDREKLPAYLESTNPRNVPLYERFGFKTMGRVQTRTSPVITPMLREARM